MARLPKHIGIIPDGNRRWAVTRGLQKQEGYAAGLPPGLQLFRLCKKVGIKEVTWYGFTKDNTKRAREQTRAYQQACISGVVDILSMEDAELLVVGRTSSPMFPKELLPYTKRTTFGSGGIKVNFLINYDWKWDLNKAMGSRVQDNDFIMQAIHSADISRIDLIIRWGGRRRLSGFLPLQSVYADFYVVDECWPDFKHEHFYEAVTWYEKQDITHGG
jgi:undecaprenyl diphosphate synthase